MKAKTGLLFVGLFFLSCSLNIFSPVQGVFPLDAQGHVLEGQRLLRDDKSQEAFQEFNTAISMDPTMGYARLGLAKAAFRLYGLDPISILQTLSSKDSLNKIPIDTFFRHGLSKIDSLYAPIHIADTVLKPMFVDTPYKCDDNFDPKWVASDFSLILTAHAFLGILDFNNDGRINELDNPFKGLSVAWVNDSLKIDGLDSLLQDSTYRAQWLTKADSTVADITLAAHVFIATFADTSIYGKVDSLLTDFKAELENHLND